MMPGSNSSARAVESTTAAGRIQCATLMMPASVGV
jgi:hypothetical protein